MRAAGLVERTPGGVDGRDHRAGRQRHRHRRSRPRRAAAIPRAAAAGVDLDVAVDRTTTIRASVHDVERTLVIAIGLVVVVVFAFLRSGWATVIPSIAVPLSLLGTFGVMWFLGYSLTTCR